MSNSCTEHWRWQNWWRDSRPWRSQARMGSHWSSPSTSRLDMFQRLV